MEQFGMFKSVNNHLADSKMQYKRGLKVTQTRAFLALAANSVAITALFGEGGLERPKSFPILEIPYPHRDKEEW